MALPLAGKTAFITGASRGIGLEIGKLLARQGVNVAVAAKTSDPNPKLPGTIHSAVEEIEREADAANSGAKALALQLDIREAEKVEEAIELTVQRFGELDIVVNNASAINMRPTVEQEPKGYDLINQINARGTWLTSRYAVPHLLRSAEKERNPHILTLSPPLDSNIFRKKGHPNRTKKGLDGAWPEEFTSTRAAYAMSKFGMSIATFSLAAELQGQVGCHCLWPYTLIGTSAMKIVSPNAEEEQRRWRSPLFVAEAAWRILQLDAKRYTGEFYIDESFLRRSASFDESTIPEYSLGGPDVPLEELADDLFLTPTIRELISRLRQAREVDGLLVYPGINDGQMRRLKIDPNHTPQARQPRDRRSGRQTETES